jgi:hypothetical protein
MGHHQRRDPREDVEEPEQLGLLQSGEDDRIEPQE